MDAREISQKICNGEPVSAADVLALGSAVRSVREKNGLTQAELAEAAGVGVGTIKNLESGARRPQKGKLEAILRVISLDDRENYTPTEAEVAGMIIGFLRGRPVSTWSTLVPIAIGAMMQHVLREDQADILPNADEGPDFERSDTLEKTAPPRTKLQQQLTESRDRGNTLPAHVEWRERERRIDPPRLDRPVAVPKGPTIKWPKEDVLDTIPGLSESEYAYMRHMRTTVRREATKYLRAQEALDPFNEALLNYAMLLQQPKLLSLSKKNLSRTLDEMIKPYMASYTERDDPRFRDYTGPISDLTQFLDAEDETEYFTIEDYLHVPRYYSIPDYFRDTLPLDLLKKIWSVRLDALESGDPDASRTEH